MSTSRLTKTALGRKRARGEKTGGIPPYGYRAEGQKLIVDQQEQEIAMRIKERRVLGTSFQKIADELNRDGVTRRGGSQWTWGFVRRLAVRDSNRFVVA